KKKIYTSLQKLMQNSDTIAKVNTIENPDFNILLQAHWRLKRFNWPDRRKDHFLNSEGAFWTPRMLMSAGMLASLASNPQVAASAFLASYITSLVSIGHGNRKNEYCSNMPSEIERTIIYGIYKSDEKFIALMQQRVQYIADQCEKIKKADAHKDDVHFAKIYNQTTGSYDIPTKGELCACYCQENNVCCKNKGNCEIDGLLRKVADDSNR
ncbi:MAG: hypothetical protein ACXWL5_00910, partial [Candidatus Chromulinivorax sp.]